MASFKRVKNALNVSMNISRVLPVNIALQVRVGDSLLINPFHTTDIQAETMYKVLTPSIKTSM